MDNDPKRLLGLASGRRARSWSPPSLADAATACGEEDDSDDGAPVLFDACRFPRPAEDFLDCALGEEPWQAATEASSQRRMRIVGEVGALKRLFSLPLRSAGEAVCLHRIGDCLIALEVPEDAREPDDYTASACAAASTANDPRASSMRSQVHVEGDMVRVYPRVDSAEPVDIDAPPGTTSPVAACCEWRVREGLSLLAVTPQVARPGSNSCDLLDLRSAQPRLMNRESWRGSDFDDLSSLTGIDVKSVPWPSPPAYHKRVTETHAAVRAVRIPDQLATEDLVDAWFSCCLLGSPSLLCFFVDSQGVFRGCRFVAAADIPHLSHIAKAYHPSQRCLANFPSSSASTAAPLGEFGLEAFDPVALRQMSHSLLETLVDRMDHDGGQCLVVAHPLGIHFLNASLQSRNDDSEDTADEGDEKAPALMLMDAPELLPGFERKKCLNTSAKTSPNKSTSSSSDASHAELNSSPTRTSLDFEQTETPIGVRPRRAHMTQALLLYHAAVRLASARVPPGATPGAVKDVPIGSRWTAKSCRHPLRVRQMMLRAVRAVHAVSAAETKNEAKGTGAPQLPKRFLLLLASAFEFLADTFLAEDSNNDESLDITRQLSALRHLQKSTNALTRYMEGVEKGGKLEDFNQSVQRLEERVLAKRANAHLCLARLRQRRLWSEDMPGLRAIGSAVQELDTAEQLLLHPPRVTQFPRPLGPHECSLLASIAKWKADLLFELVAISAPSTDGEIHVTEYLEAQQRELNESPQPLPLQRERWLQSIVSLSLRSLHHLAAVPADFAGELQAQARALLARGYGDLGHLYANTGRYTKAMTHAKQGIELFSATHDKLHAAMLQLWLCRLQLRLAVPQASSSSASAANGSLLDESALLRGLSAVNSTEDSACAQVVSALQKVLKGLEGTEAEEQAIQLELQTLLGRVILRQGLSRMARSTQFCTVCGLCEDDSAVPSMLELLQSGEPFALDGVKDGVELLLQASAYFRDANERRLNGIAHACLAAVYFRGRSDNRVQRLALTHCQHALEHLGDSGQGACDGHDVSAVLLAVQLLEAKAMRRTSNKGCSSSRANDISAAAALCNIALNCQHAAARPRRQSTERIQALAEDIEKEEDRDCPALPPTVLAGEEQRLPVMTYVRQELGDVLLRFLRGNERQEGHGRELKGLYGALLTAWHTDAGQVQALTSLRDYMLGMDNSNA